jgi:hypothetical protein
MELITYSESQSHEVCSSVDLKERAVASNETAGKRYPIVAAGHLVADDNQKRIDNTSCRHNG